MGFKTQDGFQFTGSGVGLKYVSGKRISFYLSEQGDPGADPSSGVYNGTSGIVSTNIVLDLNATINNSYGGSGTTWTDISGNSNNATLVNGVAYSSNDGGYLVFDGSNDYITLGTSINSDISVHKDCSFNIWIQFDIDSRDNVIITHPTIEGFKPLILWYDKSATSTANTGSGDVGGGNTNVLTVLVTNNPAGSTGEYRWTTANNVFGNSVTNTWHNICVVLDTTNDKYYTYLNGQQVALFNSTAVQGINSNNENFNIGYVQSGVSSWLDGNVSMFQVYSKALTASEVLQNYNATKSNYIGLITTNLVLHLDASNISSYGGSGTTWNDISGNNNDLTLTNGPTFSTRDGGTIVFDGANDYAVSALNQAFFQFGTGDYSYGVWVKVDAQGATGFESVLSSGSNSDNGSWQLDQYYSNKFRHYLQDSSGGNNEISTTTLNNYTSTWFYLFIVNDRSEDELKFYVNGTLNATGSSANYGSTNVGNFSSATDVKNVFNVANNRNQNRYMDGSVAQVHVYKGKALSASEVLQNYNATKGNFLGAISTTNLVFYLDAGKSMSYSGSGTTWTDLSSSSNNGTLINSPTFDSDFSGVLIFDGSNDRIETGSDMFDPNADFTISAWVNSDTFSGTNSYNIVSDYTNVGSFQLKYKNGDGIRITDSTVVEVGLFSNSTLSTGVWYNITVTRSSNTYTLYLNGNSTSTVTSSNTYDRGPQTIGSNYSSVAGHWEGKIAQVFAYSSALSASEVLSNYNATKDTYGYATVSDPSGIIATGLDILLDAGNSNSYSGSGTTWTNLAPSSSPFSNATLSSNSGSNTYSSNNSGYFDECRAFVPVTGSTYVTDGTTITYPTMTYSVWCYPDNLSGYQTLIDQGNDKWYFGFNGTALITYGPTTGTIAGTAANNNWYNFTMTHTQNGVNKFYVNGTKIKETGATYNNAPTFSNWSFGAGSVSATSAGNEGFQGYIAAIAVYNRALSATEVLQNHNALKSRFGL